MIIQKFEQQVEKFAEKPAVITDNKQLDTDIENFQALIHPTFLLYKIR
jgi:hypothetical protein